MAKTKRPISMTQHKQVPQVPMEPPTQKEPIGPSLEDQKQELDIKKLQYDLNQGRRLEWVKAIGPWFTALGIAATLWLGIRQLQQSQQARDDERFERSVTRLGSQQVSERLAGLTGLELFLKGSTVQRQTSALRFIVNAAVIEKDDTVRDALTDSLDRLSNSSIPQEALNSALIVARDRNRALVHRLWDSFLKDVNARGDGKWPSSPDYSEVPIGGSEIGGRTGLEASAKAIAALMRAGAHEDDLSQTYCVECEFSTTEHPLDLQRVNFNGAFLRRAKFEHANLTDASFHNADLVQAFFAGAVLKNAKLTADVPATPWQQLAAMSSGTTMAIHGADFSCSNLTSADFSGRAVFVSLYKNPVVGLFGDAFAEADLTNTKLDNIQMILGFPVDIVDSLGDKQRFDFRKLFPVDVAQWSGPSDPVPSIKGESTYYLYAVSTNANFRFTAPFDPKAFWDFILHMRNLNGAKNLDKAVLAPGLRKFMTDNQALVSPSLGRPRC